MAVKNKPVRYAKKNKKNEVYNDFFFFFYLGYIIIRKYLRKKTDGKRGRTMFFFLS